MTHTRPLVLIVDDHADTCELYQLALPHEGLEAVVAATVEDAKRCVLTQQPHVIVTDLSLAAADSFAFMRWLRETTGRRAHVIALTAWAGPEQAERAREAGCTTICVKPCLPDTLAATIRAVLAAQRLGT